MTKLNLQEPGVVYMNGGLVPWKDAVLHVGCEAVTRGLNVFEGVKGYWGEDGRFRLVEPLRHFERLKQSASLLQIPFVWDYAEFIGAMELLFGEFVR